MGELRTDLLYVFIIAQNGNVATYNVGLRVNIRMFNTPTLISIFTLGLRKEQQIQAPVVWID